MCIRDRYKTIPASDQFLHKYIVQENNFSQMLLYFQKDNDICLLYTSDAADERSSVDLGGRRIIKKKKQ